uniref:Retrotransposon gag domain-containing protein n=1 Tax=Vitis vinifera TaxID=29760 RepID=A5C7J8_VITVI|nr:hypothetical protein VITISV_024040 [Vitis vinifera]
MRKIWPSEANCSRLVRKFRTTPLLCKIRTAHACGGRLVKCETPHNKELELSLNIMEATPEDQHSHHGHQDNPNEFRSMRDRMHPPRMSAPSCIVPPTEQLVIRPHIVPLLPTFHGMECENPYAHIKEFEDKNGLKRQISNFSAKENEKFYECWERYMEAINACPHHGFDTWLLVSYFYDGMSSSMKQLLETMCGGDFMSKNPEEAMDFLSYVAEVGMYTLNEDVHMKAKFAAMTRRLEELELKKMHVQAVDETPVQKPRAPQYQQPAQPSQQASSLEQAIVNLSKVVGDFIGDQKSINAQLSQRIDSVENTLNKRMDGMQNDLSQKIDNLQYSISRLTNLNTVQEKGRFPSQPHQNPKGIHEAETHEGESSQVRDVKALITLRSGKKVELPTPKPRVEEEEEEETKKMEEIKGKKKDISEGKEDHDSTVNGNPEKDLCTIKRGLNVNKKAFLTEQVSAIIQCKSSLKYKDPGCPTISVMIGVKVVEKALLDLGASVNLLPYSIYKQLGLGELKPTSITLSLVDRSVKIPRGIIEDVLVQVDNFYYPVYFVVLDMDPIVKEANYVPIILGRPFLAILNAIINCRNGLMQLTFGNMTLELNIFYMSKKLITPEEEEGREEVCIIDTLVEDHCNQNMQDKLNESLEDLEEGLPETL